MRFLKCLTGIRKINCGGVFAIKSCKASSTTPFIRCASFPLLLMFALTLWHSHKTSSMHDMKLSIMLGSGFHLSQCQSLTIVGNFKGGCDNGVENVPNFEFRFHGFRTMSVLCRRGKKCVCRFQCRPICCGRSPTRIRPPSPPCSMIGLRRR